MDITINSANKPQHNRKKCSPHFDPMQSTLSQFAHGEVSTPRKRRDIPFESVGLEGDENSDSNDWRGVGGDEDDGDKRQEDGNVDRDLKGMDAEEKDSVDRRHES